jgi:C-terminal processing protease CtpA/Prc
MNAPSFESFERELKASGYGKKGIVIDVRYNGGGWTTDRLMAVLNVDQHAYTIPRGAAKNYRKRIKSFKVITLLTSEQFYQLIQNLLWLCVTRIVTLMQKYFHMPIKI